MEADVIADLRCKLKEVEEDRIKAAQYGLQLVESQNELQIQFLITTFLRIKLNVFNFFFLFDLVSNQVTELSDLAFRTRHSSKFDHLKSRNKIFNTMFLYSSSIIGKDIYVFYNCYCMEYFVKA